MKFIDSTQRSEKLSISLLDTDVDSVGKRKNSKNMLLSGTLSLLIAHFAIATAGVAADVAALSWEDCVRRAKIHNPELSAAKHALNAAEYQQRGSYSGFFPQASLSMGVTRNGAGAFGVSPASSATLVSPSNTSDLAYSASLSVTQNLFAGFVDAARVAQASATRESTEASLQTISARISSELKQAFANLTYAQNAQRLSREFIERRRDNFELVELRFASGRENRGSVMLSEAYLKQAELDLFQADNAMQVSRAQLARLLGFSTDTPLAVLGTIPIETHLEAPRLEQIAQNTPDVLQAKAQARTAEAGITIARAGFLPSLSVSGSIVRAGNRFFPEDQRWSIGASISLPLFQGGKDYYALKSALENDRAAELNRENSLRVSFARLNQAYATFREALKRYEVDRTFATAASTRAMIAREKYNNGLLSFEDWDVIENDLINRQKSLLQTERDRTIAEANWQQTQGKGVLR